MVASHQGEVPPTVRPGETYGEDNRAIQGSVDMDATVLPTVRQGDTSAREETLRVSSWPVVLPGDVPPTQRTDRRESLANAPEMDSASLDNAKTSSATNPEDISVTPHPPEKTVEVGRVTRIVVKHAGPCACLAFVISIVLTFGMIGAFTQSASNLGEAFSFGEFRPLNHPVIKQDEAYNQLVVDAYQDGKADDDDDEAETRELVLDTLQILYEDFDGNMLTRANVDKMAAIERAAMTEGWEDWCQLGYDKDDKESKCKSPVTILNYLYRDDDEHKKQCEDGFCLVDSVVPLCGNATGYEWGVPPCVSRVYDWRDGELADEEDWRDLLKKRLCDVNEFEAKELLDRNAYDCEDDPVVTRFTRSRYSIGGPLKGFDKVDEQRGEQVNQFTGGPFTDPELFGNQRRVALREAIDAVSATPAEGRTFATSPRGDRTISVIYTDSASGRFQEIGLLDNALGVVSLVFVFFYIWYNVGSIVIATAGAAEILLSLPLALFFWRVIMNQQRLEFLFFNTVFLILCIGADDIFVLVDSWKASKSVPGVADSLETRFVWSYNKAVNAMSTTTATTVLSLIMTTFSSIPALRAFGIFAALVVFFDFLLVITWLPCVLVWYTRRIEPCCKSCGPCCKVTQVGVDGLSEERKIVVFIREKVAPLMYTYRYAMLSLAVCATVAMAVVFGVLFRLADGLPTFIVPTHPFSRATDVNLDEFFRAEDVKNQITIVYGVNSADALEFASSGQLTRLEEDDEIVNFNPGFDLTKDLQEALVEDCENTRKNKELVDDKESYCLLRDLKRWRESDFPYDSEKELRDALEEFYESSAYRDLVDDFSDYRRVTGFVADGSDGVKAIWHGFNTTIPLEVGPGPAVLTPYFEQWNDWVAGECAFDCYHNMNDVVDRGAQWALFIILSVLTRETLATIAASLAAAFVVLLLSTRNWIVTIYVLLTIICAVVCMMACIFATGFPLGLLESVLVVLTIGLSIDYAVHHAHFYVHATGTRYEKAQESLSNIGVSVLGGAITTIFAGLPLFGSVLEFGYLFGFFILFTSMWAYFMTNFMLMPLLMIAGPEGAQGELPAFPMPWNKRHATSSTGLTT